MHGRERPRYRCKTGGRTFSGQAGTMFEGLRKPKELLVIVVTRFSYGCPTQAIVHAFDLDERTVASWRDRAGKHCQQIHQAVVQGGQLDLLHVQVTRDRRLADRLLTQVRACCQPISALLVCTDGWSAYPGSIRRALREQVKKTAGRGRACLQAWPEVCIATVIKRTEKKRVVAVLRRMTQGTLEQAQRLLAQSPGGNPLNTAFIERLHGPMRER